MPLLSLQVEEHSVAVQKRYNINYKPYSSKPKYIDAIARDF